MLTTFFDHTLAPLRGRQGMSEIHRDCGQIIRQVTRIFLFFHIVCVCVCDEMPTSGKGHLKIIMFNIIQIWYMRHQVIPLCTRIPNL